MTNYSVNPLFFILDPIFYYSIKSLTFDSVLLLDSIIFIGIPFSFYYVNLLIFVQVPIFITIILTLL